MKKMITIALIAATLAISLPVTVHAWSPPSDVVIDGKVLNGTTPVPGIHVAINCKGQFSGNFIGFATTNSAGFYTIHATTSFCWIGSTAEVRADQDGDGKFESSAVGPITTWHTTVNLELGENIAVPEFGWVGGMVAAGASLCGIVLARRHGISRG